MRVTITLLALTWTGLWFTPDQLGQRLMRQEKFPEAAHAFEDPMRQGIAWFRAGEFEKSIQAFSQLTSPESQFNRGNAWVMLGKYDQAVQSYNQALKQRPDWKEAQENRDLAEARGKLTEAKGGDMGDQKIGADKIVFDKKKKPSGEDTEVAGNKAASDAQVQAIWLRQVATNPADFLKAKFAFQQAQSSKEPNE